MASLPKYQTRPYLIIGCFLNFPEKSQTHIEDKNNPGFTGYHVCNVAASSKEKWAKDKKERELLNPKSLVSTVPALPNDASYGRSSYFYEGFGIPAKDTYTIDPVKDTEGLPDLRQDWRTKKIAPIYEAMAGTKELIYFESVPYTSFADELKPLPAQMPGQSSRSTQGDPLTQKSGQSSSSVQGSSPGQNPGQASLPTQGNPSTPDQQQDDSWREKLTQKQGLTLLVKALKPGGVIILRVKDIERNPLQLKEWLTEVIEDLEEFQDSVDKTKKWPFYIFRSQGDFFEDVRIVRKVKKVM